MSRLQTGGRVLLGAALVFAGISHLTLGRRDFRAQVPQTAVDLSPFDVDQVVVGSGVVEIALGSAIALAPREHRSTVGVIAAGFFAAVFPGNIAQWLHRRNAFGLDTDGRRFGRLFFQPVLIAWALWSTRAPRG
ncbi:hypothetical protein [Agrococcus sp. ARC_14]|uniref:DoxX family protein n=1 Tax=Agrococcus sp. ARC_14 TaxID=2919927 RepID=UPI001F050DAD|nr:hypothetical protein [Agrococcus sp. ARC_14]MCH1882466.1 hypothetical protein [Agrococcus sp. ARC_14]